LRSSPFFNAMLFHFVGEILLDFLQRPGFAANKFGFGPYDIREFDEAFPAIRNDLQPPLHIVPQEDGDIHLGHHFIGELRSTDVLCRILYSCDNSNEAFCRHFMGVEERAAGMQVD
jgi:hypothetical protein